MSSLADELAADLDFSDDQSTHSDEENQQENVDDRDDMETDEAKEEGDDRNKDEPTEQQSDSIYKVCRFLQSEQTRKILSVSYEHL